MRAVIADALQGFTSEDARGALVGPFAPLLAFPHWGGPAWQQSASLIHHKALPATVREVAILTTGAATRSRYELYAHSRVAAGAGLSVVLNGFDVPVPGGGTED